ncbi:unnamed protein product [Phyllotreta striolata]|uniref:THD domain-containing protein n=1 Tax=Phyllotreta striolata TaxID=444603 RepID=A0A9N9XN28_PHYSR|nr:unnamed protein product [Phyllotreta striolata]
MTADQKQSPDFCEPFIVRKKNPIRFFSTYGVAFLYVIIFALFVFNYLTLIRITVLESDVKSLKEKLSNVRLFDDDLINNIIRAEDEQNDDDDTEDDSKVIIPDDNINEYTDYDYYDTKNNENFTYNEYDLFKNRENSTKTEEELYKRKKRSIASTIRKDDDIVISKYNLRGRNSTGRSSGTKKYHGEPNDSSYNTKQASYKSLDSYQDSYEETTTYSPPITIVRNTGYRRRTIKHLPSVHYSGDTSKYVYGVHDNFYGNSQLRHVNEMFVDWTAKDWVDTLRMHSHFTMDNGFVTVKQSGLYLVYAQIYYLDTHDRVGFRVLRNDKTILECAITAPSIGGSMKSNTCYTAGVEHFRAGDKLWLKDIEQRLSLFANGKSFFGMVKLGNISV